MDVALLEDIAEWQKLLGIAQGPSVRAAITNKVTELQKQVGRLTEICMRGLSQVDASAVKVSSPSEATLVPLLDFAWDQESTTVKIYIDLPGATDGIPQTCVHSQFTKEAMDIKIRGVKGRPDSHFVIEKLFGAIDPSRCHAKARKSSVHITLTKASPGKWADLKKVRATAKGKDFAPDVSVENESPNAALMQMMKRLYDEGDDEMKRNISKTWAESMGAQL